MTGLETIIARTPAVVFSVKLWMDITVVLFVVFLMLLVFKWAQDRCFSWMEIIGLSSAIHQAACRN